MKFFRIVFMLSLIIIFIVIYVNSKVLFKKIKNKSDENVNSAFILHKDKHSVKEKHLKVKHGKKPKLKLSAQLAKAKKICWNGQYISNRVIDGSNAAKDTLPWMVAIFQASDKNWTHICGGAIVSTKFVLTAAHCFLGDSSPKPTDYIAHYGMHDLKGKNFVKREILEIHMQPKSKIGFKDIALIRLKHVVKYSDIISPICVPGLTTPSFWDKWSRGDTVLLSGWGVYDKMIIPDKEKTRDLKKGYGLIVKNSICKKKLNETRDRSRPVSHPFDPRTNLCIGTTKGESQSCYGDSGSPVIPLVYLEGKESFVFPVVIGVVSYGDFYCNGPTLLTEVECFINWINNVTSKLS